MSSVPADIAGIGSTAQKLRATPGFDPMRSGLGPEEYFVWSRVDGATTIRDILLATGLPVERGVAILSRLRFIGAVLLPGEVKAPTQSGEAKPPEVVGPALKPPPPRSLNPTRPPVTAPVTGRVPTQPVVARTATPASHPAPSHPPAPTGAFAAGTVSSATQPKVAASEDRVYDLSNPSGEELSALGENIELAPEDKRRILSLRRLVDKGDPYMMLGVSQGADSKQLKRAYFRLSKEIHPDRYYGKKLGTFKDKMALIFEAVSRSYARLTSPQSAASGGSNQAAAPQTPQEYAAEVFERACGLEIDGDHLAAMKLFAAAVRIDPQTRYLRRAATCALAAKQPKTAVEYAKKAQAQTPTDPSSARLLALAFKAAGKLGDAEDILVMAMAMKSENDTLMVELRNDLAEVRRLLLNG